MHAELMAFMAANQAGRQDALPVDLADRDLRRSVRVRQILANTPPETLDQADLFAAARICQHGPDPENQEQARELLLAQVEGRIVDRARSIRFERGEGS